MADTNPSVPTPPEEPEVVQGEEGLPHAQTVPGLIQTDVVGVMRQATDAESSLERPTLKPAGYEFLKNIGRSPDDDTIKLIFADWLDDNMEDEGALCAEYIRLEVEIASLVKSDPRREELLNRSWEIQRDARLNFCAFLGLGVDVLGEDSWLLWNKGLPSGLLFVQDYATPTSGRKRHFFQGAEDILAKAPSISALEWGDAYLDHHETSRLLADFLAKNTQIQRLKLGVAERYAMDAPPLLLTEAALAPLLPRLARMEGLNIPRECSSKLLTGSVDERDLSNLRLLSVEEMTYDALQALANSKAHLHSLRVYQPLSEEGWRQLLTSPVLADLTSLRVGSCSASMFEAILSSQFIPHLRTLEVNGSEHERSLELLANAQCDCLQYLSLIVGERPVNESNLHTLLSNPHFRSLRSCNLIASDHNGDEYLPILLETPLPSQLKEFHLPWTFSKEGSRKLIKAGPQFLFYGRENEEQAMREEGLL